MVPGALTLSDIDAEASDHALTILGFFNTSDTESGCPAGTRSVVLLGPREPGFWSFFQDTPEFGDGKPDPMDRWSRRVMGDLADRLQATALLPFDGPPYLPFYDWALRTGRFWSSPVAMLVHDEAGLMVSIRGALALPMHLELTGGTQSPCVTCTDRPCTSGCPVGALVEHGYDTEACHGFLDTEDGQTCLAGGCRARLACPISRRYARDAAQSAFHMRAFHRNR